MTSYWERANTLRSYLANTWVSYSEMTNTLTSYLEKANAWGNCLGRNNTQLLGEDWHIGQLLGEC